MQRRISENVKRVKDCEVVKYEPCDDEGGLHEEIIRTCRANGWYYQHDRMDKPTRGGIGACDFVIATFNDTYFIECKKKGGKMSTAQMAVGVFLNHLGRKHKAVYSIEEFRDFVK